MAWTDIPFLFLSLISFFFVFKTVRTKNKEQLICAFLSGVFTGSSLLTRNVGYALLLSIGSGFILMAVLILQFVLPDVYLLSIFHCSAAPGEWKISLI